MPESSTVLPDGYVETESIDLQKDAKRKVIINGAAVLVTAALLVIGYLIKPFDFSAIFEKSSDGFLIGAVVLVAGLIVYIVGHEAVHGIFFKLFCKKAKLKCGFTLLYAYMAGDAYYNKRDYIIIGLAPIIVFGVIFTVLLLIFPQYFWIIYILQCVNISGAAGDVYVTVKLLKSPNYVLVYDRGVSMSMFNK